MQSTGVIDRFLDVFSRYIDSGFGLLQGEVAFLATTLIVIDVTLAALFWTFGEPDNILARLIKKTLFIGAFAYIIGNWNALAKIIFDSFSGLGLKATGGSLSAADLLQPGKIAAVGLDAGRPLLESIGELMGFVSFFENFVQIAILLLAWLVVLMAFFFIAIQLFITLIEFKLTTLAGFILIPFGLFGRTAFLAERVLGNVVASGIKILVLAVIVGIGTTIFSEFTAGFAGDQPTLEDAAVLILAALSLLGLALFGPGIANGLISGGPQLGAGAAVGTGLAVAGAGVAGAAGARMAGGAAMGGVKKAAAISGAASGGFSEAKAAAGGNAGAAIAGGAKAAAFEAASPLRRAGQSISSSFADGKARASGSADDGSGAAAPEPDQGQPRWAKKMHRAQNLKSGGALAAHAVRSSDSGGSSTQVNVKED
ncbi:MAG: P-type conjugative transfer protein TrbL [Sphingomonadales bacterium]|nr:P-type conjugative transfer protein TrbL [Sphingomonadales bacterium]